MPKNESTLPENELPDFESCWTLLERVAASTQLKRAPRLQEVLLYVGRRLLKDGCDHVNEHEIGCSVFGRPATYDTGLDNIVRTNVSELRKRIETYFDSEGLHETLTMEIPRGSYIPVFRYRPAEPQIVAEPPATASPPVSELPAASANIPQTFDRRRWMLSGLIVAGMIIVGLAIGCIDLWIQNRAKQRSLYEMDQAFYPWRYEPAVAALWSGFLNASPETDVVLPDMGFAIIQRISNKSFSFSAYFNRRYMSELQDLSPDKRADLSQIDARSLGAANGFKLALRFLDLDPLHERIHLYSARNYMPDLLKRGNLILIGARTANPWDELFQSRMNFTVSADAGSSTIQNIDTSSSTITNRSPAAGEQTTYTRTDSVEYCVVAYLPNPNSNGKVFLIQGTNQEATEACGDFLLSEDQLTNFQKVLHLAKLPYFEVLLKTSQVKDTPLTATIEAYRAYPNLR